MTVATRTSAPLAFRSLFPNLEPARPLAWFFAEEFLEARSLSDHPTNSRMPDEDVNMYLIGLLTRWAAGDPRPGVEPGRDPVLAPSSPGGGTLAMVEHLRRQADHRLLALGLFDRGDLVRRRLVGWRMTADETRRRDQTVAGHCYRLAARLLAGRHDGRQGLATVWWKLAADLPGYVLVLQTLARRRLGLGARLSEAELEHLLADV
jgi:hypothetical protein